MSATLPTAEQLAQVFHETYERMAPQYGYETRVGTREFNPLTSNGKLMIATCEEVLRPFVSAFSEGRSIKDKLAWCVEDLTKQLKARERELSKVLQQQAEADNERDAVEEGLRAYAELLRSVLERVSNVLSTTSADCMPVTNAERDELILDIDAALATNECPSSPIGRGKGLKTPHSAGSTPASGTNNEGNGNESPSGTHRSLAEPDAQSGSEGLASGAETVLAIAPGSAEAVAPSSSMDDAQLGREAGVEGFAQPAGGHSTEGGSPHSPSSTHLEFETYSDAIKRALDTGEAVTLTAEQARAAYADIGALRHQSCTQLPNIRILHRGAPDSVVIRFARDITNEEVEAVGKVWTAAQRSRSVACKELDAAPLLAEGGLSFPWGRACVACGKPVNYPTNRYMPGAVVMDGKVWHANCTQSSIYESIGCNKQEVPAEFAAFVSFNGTRQRWTDPVITYAQAVANCTHGNARPADIYTVSYSTPSGKDGTLRPGQQTNVEEGMVIDAGITNRA